MEAGTFVSLEETPNKGLGLTAHSVVMVVDGRSGRNKRMESLGWRYIWRAQGSRVENSMLRITLKAEAALVHME